MTHPDPKVYISNKVNRLMDKSDSVLTLNLSPPTRTSTELRTLGIRLVSTVNFSEPPVFITVYTGRVERLQHGGGRSQSLQVVNVRLEMFVKIVFVQELTVAGTHVGHPVAVVGASGSC